MKLFRFALVFMMATLFASPALAATERFSVGLQDVIATVEKSFSPSSVYPDGRSRFLEDVTADFFQRTTLVEKERELRADGQMFVMTASERTPLMFRFDYYRPTSQEIVCNGRTMWTYLPENRQVILSDVSFLLDQRMFDPDRSRAVNFLQGLASISRDFQILYSEDRQDMAGNYVLELTPRRSMANIQKMFIVVNRESVARYVKNGRNIATGVPFRQELAFPILSTTVIDHKGNSTTMEFSNIRTNTRLNDGLFNFSIPPDAQVVRPSAGR